uniref:Uncharacterized protein sbr0013 n=1 Tax=cyanobacterium endosymbiont of Rhopalodia gibba TaxID=309035 RepID=A1KYL9_9CYAN|nr:hypothetical protein [cyanobacterium endosymbiont of Rhopalodia gibba]
MILFNFSGIRPINLGVKDSKLALYPKTLNCVNSQSSIPQFKIEPLPPISIAEFSKVIESLERANLIEETENYLYAYAEFKTKLMGYVDDAEFYLDLNENVIHVRSASRLGKFDLEVNRQRIEEIRSQL